MQLPAFEREWHGVRLAGLMPSGAASSLPDNYAAIYREAAAAKADDSSWRSPKLRMAGFVADVIRETLGASAPTIDLLSLGAGTGVMEEAWIEAGFKVAVQECQRFSLAAFQGNHPAVPVFMGSADAVGAPAGSFDAVVLCAIDYVFPAAEYVRVLKETHRLLRPGGVAVVVSVSHLCAGSLVRTAVRAAIETAVGKLGTRSRRVFWGWKRTAGEHLRAGAEAGMRLTRLCVRNEAGVRDVGRLAADLTTGSHDLVMVWTRPPIGMGAKPGLIGSPMTLLRHSMMFSGANVIGVAVGAGATATAAVMLGPEAFGIIATMQLVLLGASLLRLGVCTAAAREVPALLAQNREMDARALQNTAFFAELLMAIVVGCLIVIVGTARFAGPTARALVFIVAVGHIVSTAQVYLVELHWAHGRYARISQNVLLLKVLTAALTVAGAWAFGVPGVLLASVVAAAMVIGSYLLFAPSLHLRLSVERGTFTRLLRRGLPLAFAIGAFSLGRQVERFVLVGTITAHELGLYAFAANLIVLAQGVVIDFGSVVQVPMYRHLGAGADPATVIAETASLDRTLVLVAAVGASFVQVAFAPVAFMFLPAYGGSVAVLEILAVIIVTAAVSVVPTLLLRSPAVDRLYSLGAVQAALVILQAGMTLAAINIWPHWLVGASCAVVCAEILTSAGLLWLLRRVRGVSARSDWSSLGFSVVCVGVVAALAALFQLPAFAPSVHGIPLALGARLLGAIGVWTIAALIFLGSRTPQPIPAWREASREGSVG